VTQVRGVTDRLRRTATDRAQRDTDALARRVRVLLTEHALADVIAIVVIEAMGAQRDDELINAHQAGIPPKVWRRLITSGELAGTLIGREYRASRADVTAYVERMRALPRERVSTPRVNGKVMSADFASVIGSGKVSA
jgi:hypothetical protein